MGGRGWGRGEQEESGMLSFDRWASAQPTPEVQETQKQKSEGLVGQGLGGASWVYNFGLPSYVLSHFRGECGQITAVGEVGPGHL